MKTGRRGLILIIAGILIVVLGVLVIGRIMQGVFLPAAPLPAPTPVTESVLIAGRGVPVGTVLGPNDLTIINLPVELVPLNRLNDVNDAIGKVAMTSMVAGEMVLPHHLADPSNIVDSTMAFAIGDDQVLMAFPIVDLMGSLNILKKGDLIDFLVTIESDRKSVV